MVATIGFRVCSASFLGFMLADDWGLVIWILEVAGHLGEIAKGGGGRRRSLFLDELVVK